jgi:hypothetical protein
LLVASGAQRLLDERISGPEPLYRAVDELARGVVALADYPESTDARRRTRDLAHEAERTAAPGTGHHPHVVVIADQVKLAAADVLRVAAPDEPKSESAESPGK